MTRFALVLLMIASVMSAGVADDGQPEVDWEQKYQQLLKDRPEIRKKVESGGATKEQVINWMKQGGDRQKPKGGKNYYGAKIEVKDPAEFRTAEEEPVFSGPQPGERLPPFTATVLKGDLRGKQLDPVAQADGKPLVLIFQDNSVVGQKGLLLCGGVLARIAEKSEQGLQVSSTFLVDDPTLSEIFEYDFMDKINGIVQMSVSPDRRDGPGAYGLNRNVAMTIIVAREGKVLHNFALKQPMLYPDPYVLGAIADAIDVDRSTLAGWFQTDQAQDGAYTKQKSGQRDAKPKTTNPQAATGKKAREAQEDQARQYRSRREYEVKDPADFKSEGKPVYSGPQPTEPLPSLKVTALAGEHKGQTRDLVSAARDQTQIIFFQDDSGVAARGLFGIGRAIARIRSQTDTELQLSVVFLADDVAQLGRYNELFPKLLELGVNSVAFSPDGRDGPGAYGLDRTVSQTIILAKDGKVTRNFAFPQGMLYPDPHLLGAIAELIGEEREAVAGWLAEAEKRESRMEPSRENDRTSAAFRAKLGEFVRAGKLTREEAAELYRAAFPETR